MALVPIYAVRAVFDGLAHFQNNYMTLQEKYEILALDMLPLIPNLESCYYNCFYLFKIKPAIIYPKNNFYYLHYESLKYR